MIVVSSCFGCQRKLDKTSEQYCADGNALFKKGKWAEAVDTFSNAIAVDHHCVAAYDKRGDAYFCLGDLSKAMNDYNRLLELDPMSIEGYLGRVNVNIKLRNDEQAIDDLTKMIRIDDSWAWHEKRGQLLREVGRWEEAEAEIAKANALMPSGFTPADPVLPSRDR